MKKKKSNGLRDTAWTFFYAIVIAIVVRTVAYEPFNIPSSSMVPTLLVGDYLFVSKFAYGYSRYSLPLSLDLIEERIFEGLPERGDVAVFKRPPENEVDFIKRLIGLPGDRIQMIDGQLLINGEMVTRQRIDDYQIVGFGGIARPVPQYIETLPNGVSYRIIEERGDKGPLDNTAEYIVPEGHYLAMGDNRDNSADGRGDSRTAWFVPVKNLVGPADFLFFSTDGSARLWEIWRWPQATRFGRIFDDVN
ncbi:MAG: signal peptidase I [Alphaproteobacteria bacterium]|nr:signal peptidase I [Alphaproteobacteria bacterium]